MSFHQTLTDGRIPAPEDLDWLLASRALAFGEGVFTSIRVWQGQAIFWPAHLQRLRSGLEGLGAHLDQSFWSCLEQEVEQLAARLEEGMLKVMLLAGPGGRGYRRSTSSQRWHRVLQARPLSLIAEAYQGIPLWWMPSPAAGPQTASKHLNRLCQVLASDACPEAYPEALLYKGDDQIIEGIARNVFWYAEGCWWTPSLATGALAGVMRRQLLDSFPVRELETAKLAQLQKADEVFVCNSVQGIWPVVSLQSEAGHLGRWPLGSKTQELMQTFHPKMGLPLS
ncbi:4-amino-4-deoxychorismate lyase [Marinospirillum celere]|uniref:4-amino-4-deoxychorismate lyase n=1 Tax=Marinospirillum celere TaxID=1122252 RepID=A0A1I1EWH7_9GAMM|nr:aminotransferase class IV [Marinospirillum celere]SFB91327.1 4-amino-4-deoxychorismate lyase [Marinospirillum celere]